MKNLLLFAMIAATAPTIFVFPQDITITAFQDGHLTFTNAASATQRFLYTVDWRPNFSPNSIWNQGWSGRFEAAGASNSLTVDVPMFFRVTAYGDNLTGYTYDWASTRPNHVGLSEFVIPSGTLWNRQSNAVPIEVEAVLAASTYGKNQ